LRGAALFGFLDGWLKEFILMGRIKIAAIKDSRAIREGE
jgi:hypothetical protein